MKDGKVVPTFPQAKYYLQKSNLQTAQNPNVRERASYFAANFQPLLEANQLQIIEGERTDSHFDSKELLPHISIFVSNGHTIGHQVVKVSDGKTTLLYGGDVFPTSTHVRLGWIMGYDLSPLTIIGEKEFLLNQAAEHNWYLYFEHDPYCDAAQVEKNGEDFKVKERFTFEAPL